MSPGPRKAFVGAAILPLLLVACVSEPVAEPNGLPQAGTTEGTPGAQPLIGERVVLEVAQNPVDDAVICRRESLTGTYQKRVVCRTRAERRETQRDAQDWMRSGGLRGGASRVPTVR